MRATTDSLREVRFDLSRPGVFNLLTIYEVLTGQSRPSIETQFEAKGYGDLKREVADVVIAALEPIQKRCQELLTSGELEDVLRDGAARAASVANETLKHVKYAMGFI